MSRTIKLACGVPVLVDDEDFERLSAYRWHVIRRVGGRIEKGYAARSVQVANGRQGFIFMHRELMGSPAGRQVDHRNGDHFDNRKSNLRVCTNAQNSHNRPPSKHSATGFKGVRFFRNSRRNPYAAQINVDGKVISLGRFDDPVRAAEAYDAAAQVHHGEFAWLNFPNRREAQAA